MATAAASATVTPAPVFASQERVLCYHGPLIYEAKVLKTKTDAEGLPQYLVHYKGWKQTWDEWVPANRLLKVTEENLTLQKNLAQANPTNPHSGSTIYKTHHRSTAGGNKDSASARTGARKDGQRGTKRGRDDDDGSKKPEMKLTVPELLKTILVDDWENITKNNQALPREPNAATVLAEFAEHIKKTKPSHLKEPALVVQTVVDGLQSYFDKALGATLLYRFERPQYAKMRREYWTGPHVIAGQEKEMSYIYGAEHLLRMLVSLPQMIAATTLDSESVILIRDYTNELMQYMVEHKDRIFQKPYENAPLDYQNAARS
ncbi:hypothetical protein D9613_009180 [Agrocybe pediades]|uniref:Chromatin modification-related protein EAF3 n=1 Tax=Agrocybe pediades TaxID=84607 RepID=A0A8H4R6C4_9AGAR|nr:hypothetical protein D9613_009180 [Agrocybe pediades]